jgi:GTP-binding protein HflX
MSKDDISRLRERVEKEIVKQMEYYHVEIAPEDGRRLSAMKAETILIDQHFDEDKGVYECKGYAPANYHNTERNETKE